MKNYRSRVCLEQYHDLAASLLKTGGGNGVEDDYFMAIERGDVEAVKCILNSIQPLDVKSWVNLKKGDETRDTPLIIAARKGFLELVKLLIIMGADPTLTNSSNLTALHVTKDKCRNMLLKSAGRTPSKTTALLASSWLGNKFTVEDILKKSQIDVNTRNLDYFTPLLLVTRDIEIFDKISFDDTVEYEPVQVAAELISYNTNVMKACDDIGRNAVHLAAGHTGSTALKLVELLLDNCQEDDLEAKDSRANTPLHYATQSGDRDIVASLIRHGADPNAVGDRGYTPLHLSATRGTVEVAGFLLENGADIRIVNDAGDSAYQVAKTEGMKQKLKEAWTEATQLERTDSQLTLTESCVMDSTEMGEGIDPNRCEDQKGTQRRGNHRDESGSTTPTIQDVAIDDANDISNVDVTVTQVRNGFTHAADSAEVGSRKRVSYRDQLNAEIDEVTEEIDRFNLIPVNRTTDISQDVIALRASQEQTSFLINVKNDSTFISKKKSKRLSKRRVTKPPTEEKLKALSMPKRSRTQKDSAPPAKSSDNPNAAPTQSKRTSGPYSDQLAGVLSSTHLLASDQATHRNRQPDSLRPGGRQGADQNVQGMGTAGSPCKTGGKEGKDVKFSVFERLHRTPIRNVKATVKSDVNLLAQIQEETDTSNVQDAPRPVVVNFGGIQGLGIGGGAVVMTGNKGNNPPVRFFLLDINQVPEKRRAVNENSQLRHSGHHPAAAGKSIPSRVPDPAKTINSKHLAVVAQKLSGESRATEDVVAAHKPTQSDGVVYDLKTPEDEISPDLSSLQRCSSAVTLPVPADDDTHEIPDDGLSSEQEIENSLEDTSESNPVLDSPIPPRPVTPLGSVSSHVSLPRLSESPHLTRSRRCSVEEHSINLSASLRKSSLSHNNDEKFLPSISPARSISNPEKQTSLRTRSKSCDVLSLSKSLSDNNLPSTKEPEIIMDEAIFGRCSSLTHRPPTTITNTSPKSYRPQEVPTSPMSREETLVNQVVNSPRLRASSPHTPVVRSRANSRHSILPNPLIASVEGAILPTPTSPMIDKHLRTSFPPLQANFFSQLPCKDFTQSPLHPVSAEEGIRECPSIPDIEKEAVNSDEIVSVLGKSKSRITQSKTSFMSRMASQRSHLISEVNENEGEDEIDDDEGTEVIRWKRGAVLGIGAYGTVVRGLTLDKGMIIAVKQIELNYFDLDKAQKQYELVKTEVDVLKRLTHENIVKYLGSCLDDMTVNIFMEFVAGGSISKLLKSFGPFEESCLRNYTRQIVSGVEYLHSRTVIHRDVKGDNIMVEPSGCIKLIDFGCARAFRDNESSTLSYEKFNMLCKSMKGTVYWMAPEVIREEEYNEKADVWSIGCTVFEMATGKPPWALNGLSPEAALFRIGMGYDLPNMPNTFSDGAKEFVEKCLQKDPKNRPSAKRLLSCQFLKE